MTSSSSSLSSSPQDLCGEEAWGHSSMLRENWCECVWSPYWKRKMFSVARGIWSNCRKSGLAYSLMFARTYKVRSSLKLMCSGCKFVKRKGRLRVICKNKKTHKQKQAWCTIAGNFSYMMDLLMCWLHVKKFSISVKETFVRVMVCLETAGTW